MMVFAEDVYLGCMYAKDLNKFVRDFLESIGVDKTFVPKFITSKEATLWLLVTLIDEKVPISFQNKELNKTVLDDLSELVYEYFWYKKRGRVY